MSISTYKYIKILHTLYHTNTFMCLKTSTSNEFRTLIITRVIGEKHGSPIDCILYIIHYKKIKS